MSSLLGGGNAPKPAPFIKTDIAKDQALATQFDTIGYNLSDSDFLARFPGLVALRDANITDATNQVTGPLDPAVENAFASSALSSTLSAFGGGTGSIGTPGSAARGAIGASIANQTQTKQDSDRLNLLNLIQANPERQFGLTGGDVVNLMIANVLGKNQAKYGAYASGVQTSNAQSAAAAQDVISAIGAAISIAGIAASDERLKTNIKWVGISPNGIPTCEFEYCNAPGVRYRGTTAQAVQPVRPDAVIKRGDYLFVDYSKLDVPLEAIR